MRKIRYLTFDEVKEINRLLGCEGIISEGNLEFILTKIKDLNISIERKAITLLFDLITSHPFLDCNKRTAFISMQIFLSRNGKKLEYNETNEYLLKRLLYDIADNNITYGEVEGIVMGMMV